MNGMASVCSCCANLKCKKRLKLSAIEDCSSNIIFFEGLEKTIYFYYPEKRIYKFSNEDEVKELDFKEAVREIDIIPSKTPEWKKSQILNLAKYLGIFGLSC